MKKTKIISAFPACGKTYAFKKLNEKGYKILDSDSSQFSWCYDYDPTISDKIEKYRNPEFPSNYIQHIKENIGKADYIFVNSHKEVRDALIENGISFTLVYPDRSMKAEWIGRFFLRGSGEKFCQLLQIIGIVGLMRWKKLSATNGFLEIKNQSTNIITLVN